MRQYPAPTADGDVLTLDSTSPFGVSWQTPSSGGGGGGAPTTATYVTMTLNGTLTGERVLTVDSTLSLVDGGANGPVTLSVLAIPESAVTGLIGDLVALDAAIDAVAADVLVLSAAITAAAGVRGTITLDLGGRSSGSFSISDAGLTLGMGVLVAWQGGDEAEFDSITAVAGSATAGAALVYWRSTGRRYGNHTFCYVGG